MIVFDVDGTLVSDEKADWSCFQTAFQDAAGFGLDAAFFAELKEVTSQSIVHTALADRPEHERRETEQAVCAGFVRNLRRVHAAQTDAFKPKAGAADLLRELQARGVPVAIATGDWRESILFKLEASGLQIDGIPVMTSSDHRCRSDIIRSAVAKVGRPLSEAVYVGDGPWDLRACRQLGIPFIGVGARRDELRTAGAEHVLADLEPAAFLPVWEALRS